jgi:hypothetical protein
MRFLDTERLLPAANHPYVFGYYKSKPYGSWETDNDPNCELGFAVNGAGPFYVAAATYATGLINSSAIETMIQPQVSPLMNCGMQAGRFSSHIEATTLQSHYGTYFEGWRRGEKNLGTVVTNPIPMFNDYKRYDEEVTVKLWSEKRRKGARFQGYFTAVHENKERNQAKLTVCGFYGGLSNTNRRHWGIDEGKATDSGLAYSFAAGYRAASWIRGPDFAFNPASYIWKKASRMLRAYTGFVAQAAGSSPYHPTVYFLANGCWEQVRASTFYCRSLDFEEQLSKQLLLEGRGASKFHMLDLLDLHKNEKRLTSEVSSWNGNHPKFLDNVFTIEDITITSFNGDSKRGTVERKIPYVNLSDRKQVAALAACRVLVGGFRSLVIPIRRGSGNITHTYTGGVRFNGGEGVEVRTPPDFTETIIDNLFVIEPDKREDDKSDVVTAEDALRTRWSPPPEERVTLTQRLRSKVKPKRETYPNATAKDDGLLPGITDVAVQQDNKCLRLTISCDGQAPRSVPFMPTSVLLIEKRNEVLRAHNKIASGNYGYGYLPEDSSTNGDGIPVFNTAPSESSYGGQERWHIPYKDLVALSYRRAVGAIPKSGFSTSGFAKPNPYIFEAVSKNNPANRYTAYDLQVRPPTFLPLVMCAEVCHEGGATQFIIKLAKGLKRDLQIEVTPKGVVKFAVKAPNWTDATGYYESIITILLMAGEKVTSYSVAGSSPVEVDYVDDYVLNGSPSDSFWEIISKTAGVDGMSDLITHYGVTDYVINIPTSVFTAAAIKDPIAFARSMGITVIKLDEGYAIGTRIYKDLPSLVRELARIAEQVAASDTASVKNVMAALGLSYTSNVKARPKRYAKPFNWLLLAPHVVTATALTVAKVNQEKSLS